MMVFYAADRDGNGKVTREELEALFRAADSGGAGFLSLGDLQEALTPPSRGRGSSGGSQGPSRLTLVKGLFRQEIGSLQPGPAVGTPAPDFTLKTVDGQQEITLSKLVGPKPVVLIFGNFTCGPFRGQAGNVEKLYRRYKDRATFVMVYVREAHPIDGWRMESNDRVEVSIAQPASDAERIQVAQACSKRLELGMPMLVDTIGDTVGARYSGMPSRLYLHRPSRPGRLQERPRTVRLQAGRARALAGPAAPGRVPRAEAEGVRRRPRPRRTGTTAGDAEPESAPGPAPDRRRPTDTRSPRPRARTTAWTTRARPRNRNPARACRGGWAWRRPRRWSWAR